MNSLRGKILQEIQNILLKESELIEIKKAKKVIFVGDTHGDLEASQKVIKEYLKTRVRQSRAKGEDETLVSSTAGNKIVFLGDYVDRDPQSKENLDFLLEIKAKYPKQIFLLQGNHEGYHVLKFSPAEFWESLSETDFKKYCSIVEKFPLAVVTKDIIALHGVLPDIETSKTVLDASREINKIRLGSKQWQQITWGDFSEEEGEYLGIDIFTGRPKFGRDYFFKLMGRLNKKVLIRSHQPDCPQYIFEDKCLTIFTSSVYHRERTIAVFDFKNEVKTAKDLEIKKI